MLAQAQSLRFEALSVNKCNQWLMFDGLFFYLSKQAECAGNVAKGVDASSNFPALVVRTARQF